MKYKSTVFLRLALVAFGLMAFGLAALVLPAMYTGWAEEYPQLTSLRYPAVILLGATVIPFFVALIQTWKLLGYVDRNTAFSNASVRALRTIKYSAVAFSVLYALFLPIVYQWAQADDAPGLMVIGLIMTCAPIVIAVFAAVLQLLLKNAIAIKSENDLTV